MDFIGQLIASPIICIGWIIIGFMAGALARRIMGSRNAGCASDILLGLVGAFVGGFVASWLKFNRAEGGVSGFLASLLIAIVGSCILIGLGRIISPRRR